MGVPSLFRWIQKKYPAIVSRCIETNEDDNPDDPNPNTSGDIPFDCLYLDMNGIIHPCFHPKEGEAPKDEKEIFNNVFEYTDRVFNIVRPQKLLFLAIDGPAPQAKINQQRSRRYRAAKESEHSLKEKANSLTESEASYLLSEEYRRNHDSNVITPGTPFMERLSYALRQYIRDRKEKYNSWGNINVILSDSSVPGEGEHKIMAFIRSQRVQSGYCPETRHCIYGLDADLLFLGIVTHEIYVTIIREDVFGTLGEEKTINRIGPIKFHFVSLWVLRQYLERDLSPPSIDFEWNFERALEDFVLLCVAVGNDFLPPLPGFNIMKGAIDQIIEVYPRILKSLNGYISDNGEINNDRLVQTILALSSMENNGLQEILFPSEKSLALQNKINQITNPSKDYSSFVITNQNTKSFLELKTMYYHNKFLCDYQEKDCIRNIVVDYCKGMIWTLQYYIHGCSSWDWYYPHYYSPMPSDLYLLPSDFNLSSFSIGKPIEPLYQLFAVLPPVSSFCLPESIRKLMFDNDNIKIFPSEFEIDMNGNTQSWKGIAKIPFIDMSHLKNMVNNAMDQIMFIEGHNFLFLSKNENHQNTNIFGELHLDESNHIAKFRYLDPPKDLCLCFTHINAKTPRRIIPKTKLNNQENKHLFCLEIPGIPHNEPLDYRKTFVQKKTETNFLQIGKKKKVSLFLS